MICLRGHENVTGRTVQICSRPPADKGRESQPAHPHGQQVGLNLAHGLCDSHVSFVAIKDDLSRWKWKVAATLEKSLHFVLKISADLRESLVFEFLQLMVRESNECRERRLIHVQKMKCRLRSEFDCRV